MSIVEKLEKLANGWAQSYSLERRNDADELRSLLPTSDSEQAASKGESMNDRDVWWMIERGTGQWWSGNDGWSHWTTDANKAVHFSRRVDAEAVIAGRDYSNPSWRDCNPFVTSHRYITAEGEQREVVDLADETLPLMPTGKYTRPTEQREVADLVAAAEQRAATMLLSRAETAEAEVADLRRNLEGARADLDREKDESDKAVEELRGRLTEERRKLVSSSLANAALRTALVKCWNYIATGPHNPGQLEEAVVAGRDALAALPTDGIAEEVVWLLENGMTRTPYTDDKKDWWVRRDALLAKLGGPK